MTTEKDTYYDDDACDDPKSIMFDATVISS